MRDVKNSGAGKITELQRILYMLKCDGERVLLLTLNLRWAAPLWRIRLYRGCVGTALAFDVVHQDTSAAEPSTKARLEGSSA